MFKWIKVGLPLMILLSLFSSAAFAQADAQLIVQVITDQITYQAGDTVNIEIRTFFDGMLTSADIVHAEMKITLPNGKVSTKDIRDTLVMVSPGVYVASGIAKAPGRRDVEVVAKLKKKFGCHCGAKTKIFKSQGVASYNVQAEPLVVTISSNKTEHSFCNKVSVTITLSKGADIQLFVISKHGAPGAKRNLILPAWVGAGEHTIEFHPTHFDVGEVTIKVVAKDHYGLTAVATIDLVFTEEFCDCPH